MPRLLMKPLCADSMGGAPPWRLLAALLILLVLVIPQASWARKRSKPPAREEVAQVWIGWSTDELYLLRLDLFPNGKGLGGFIFLGEEPRTFRINSWKYNEGQIEVFPGTPEGPPSWVGPLRGSIVGLAMRLTTAGRDWKLSFLLRREAEFEEKLRHLELKMADQPK
jgi:hypothetical protein